MTSKTQRELDSPGPSAPQFHFLPSARMKRGVQVGKTATVQESYKQEREQAWALKNSGKEINTTDLRLTFHPEAEMKLARKAIPLQGKTGREGVLA